MAPPTPRSWRRRSSASATRRSGAGSGSSRKTWPRVSSCDRIAGGPVPGHRPAIPAFVAHGVPPVIPRYTLPEMAAVWSDEARLRHWLQIEVLACEAWTRLGRIPESDRAGIRSRASFDIDRVGQVERVTNHDVAAFVQVVGES